MSDDKIMPAFFFTVLTPMINCGNNRDNFSLFRLSDEENEEKTIAAVIPAHKALLNFETVLSVITITSKIKTCIYKQFADFQNALVNIDLKCCNLILGVFSVFIH